MMRPDINGTDEDTDWQGTLLDRGPQGRRRPISSSREPEPKGRFWIAAVAFVVVAAVIIVTMMIKGGGTGGNAPLIKADVTPYKTRPDQPGGTNVPFQDKLVFNRLDPNGQPVQAEKLLPPPEEPLARDATPKDMTTKQVTAPPAPGNTPTNGAAPLIVKPATPPEPIAEAPVPQAAPVATVEPATPTPAPVAKVETPKVVETPKPVETKVAETPKPTPTVAPTPAAKPAPVASGQVRIQLASIPEAGNAQKALADLSGKYRGALGGASLGIVKADLGAKGTYYRIQSGGVDRATADRICASIKAQGGACIIAH